MKKIMLIISIVVLSIIIIFLIEGKQQKIQGDLYQNQIGLTNFSELLKNEKDLFVYFYQTDCIYCKKTTPIIVPLAKEMNIDLKVFNLQENETGWEMYGIEGTPTIVHYREGRESSRIAGQQDEKTYKAWFEDRK